MKTRMYLMLFLLLFSVGGIVWASAALSHIQTQVELYPTTIGGDPQAAQGLSLHYGVSGDQQLLWETDYAFGGEPETTFSFDRDTVDYTALTPTNFQGVHLSFSGLSYISSGFPGDPEHMDPDEFGALGPLIQDVASRTPVGTEHREVLRLRDYLDSYPLEASLAKHGTYMPLMPLMVMDKEREALAPLSEAFAFPVLEDHCIEIAIRRDANGQYAGFEIRTPRPGTVGSTWDRPWVEESHETTGTADHASPKAPMSIYTISTDYKMYDHMAVKKASEPQWIYFVVEARDEDGRILDYSHTPGGYAIYRLPVTGEKPIDLVAQIETVAPLDPESVVLALETSFDGSELYVVTGTDTSATLHILDAETGREKQSLPTVTGTGMYHMQGGEDFVLLSTDYSLRLYRREADGTYTEAIAADLEAGTYDFVLNKWLDAVYDGQRLALIYTPMNRWFRDTYWHFDVGFKILVCDSQGLRYAGSFDHSLNRSPSGTNSTVCIPEIPLVKLSWS